MRKTRITIAGLAAVTMLAGGAGLASASARPASSAVSGTEHFNLMSTQPNASRFVVIVSGLFAGGGVDISGNTTDTVKLTGGTFKVHHGGPFHVIKQQLNPKTCVGLFEGTTGLTLGNGTGKYARISGSGKALISSLFIARRSHGVCNPNLTSVVNEQTITASAHVHL